MSIIDDGIKYLKEWWTQYQKQKKSDALFNKLHRYDGVKFTQKQNAKDMQLQMKKMRANKPKKVKEEKKEEEK